MTLTDMRNRLRIDLHDEDSSDYRWTDVQLDRHLARAVRELSAAQPRPDVATIQTGSDGITLSLASQTDLIRVEAVEFPLGDTPPSYVDFSLRGATLTLLTEEMPGRGESVKVSYGRLHTLTASTSTIPPHMEELVLAGAAGYAAMDRSVLHINSVNLGGPDTWRHFLMWGQEKLSYFRQSLTDLDQQSKAGQNNRHSEEPGQPEPSQPTNPASLRTLRLYRPLDPPNNETIHGGC